MRIDMVLDDKLIADAMKAGPYKTKRAAVEAGLQLLARKAAYREILKWEGRLKWEGDESIDWTVPSATEPDQTLLTARRVPPSTRRRTGF